MTCLCSQGVSNCCCLAFSQRLSSISQDAERVTAGAVEEVAGVLAQADLALTYQTTEHFRIELRKVCQCLLPNVFDTLLCSIPRHFVRHECAAQQCENNTAGTCT